MTKLHLSKFEKVAGSFVLGGIVVISMGWLAAALKQGWLESRVEYYSMFQSGEGLYAGLDVLLSGIRVGSVTQVEILDTNEVKVQFTVLEKYSSKIRTDSKAMLIRPLVLGEKALEITLGDPSQELLEPGHQIASRQTFDVMSLLSGRVGNDHFANISETFENLAGVMKVLLEKERLDGFVKTIERIDPLLKNLDTMSKEVTVLSKQVNKNENIGKLVKDLAVVSQEIKVILPEVKERAPAMANNFEKLVENMAVLSDQFKVIGPAIAEIGPELPGATRKALEALDETLVLLKAFQKSFLLKSHAEAVREEEAQKRAPAKQKDD